ncbi:MAG: PBP1A family penicillin-binding protein, partial [Deltaproteobacteria bacterium]|nr:PBP1A family penicillin-binding protein [Deltaproteobacteria bacterium]
MKRKPRTRPRRRRPSIGRRLFIFAVKLAVYACLLGAGVLTIYTLYVSEQVQERFAGRRWSIPSRVYSDTTLLYPGRPATAALLESTLKNLSYRPVQRMPDAPGEYRVRGSSIEISLRELTVPGRQRPAFPVRIQLAGGQIESIRDCLNEEPLHTLELEPEEVMLFFGPLREQRELIALGSMPPHLLHAVLAAEDRRFYEHAGIDPVGILRAALINLRHGGVRAGGSTITQQLAKCYFLTPERSFLRKFKELCIALSMELRYSKDEILEIYLNEIYLGQKGSVSISGIAEASKFYFGKRAEDLSVAEAATIAGLIRAPNRYSPYADAERSRERRNAVIAAMQENGWLSADDGRAAGEAPIETAGYTARPRIAAYFMDYVARQLHELYSADDLANLGLSIHTTIDAQVQRSAEQALERGLKRLEARFPQFKSPDPDKKLQGAIVVMQPRTGAILAMVGGRDYGESQFNRITQARRQPGSAFKPIVYLSALDRLTPATMLSNEPVTYNLHGRLWSPKNYDDKAPPQLLLRDALALSVNRAAVAAAMQTGLERIIACARSLGITSKLEPYPSMALGSFEIIPLELARAYCCFAADGMLPYPRALSLVTDEQGRILEQRHMEIKRAITPAKAFLISSLLQSVVSDGTARGLRAMGVTFPSAGKTGTTDDNRDAWYVGYTPDIVALVWVGFDDGRNVRSTGSGAALPIWAELMLAIPQHISGTWLAQPPGIIRFTICRRSGMPADSGACSETRVEYFLTENVPDQTCTMCRSTGAGNRIQNFMKG